MTDVFSEEVQIAAVAAFGLAIFGLVSSVAPAISVGAPLGDVTPWWIATYVVHAGVTPAVTKAATADGIAVVLAPLLLLLRTPRTDLGRARFATRGEARRARLLTDSGILLGTLGRQLLRNDEPLHVLVAAPTRSGKGVGIVIANLLSWPGSALVLDIKYENHALTSGFRAAHGQAVYRFSPADASGRSHRYNPLDAIRTAPSHRVSDLQRLAVILLPKPLGAKDSFWQDEARSLFLGLALYVLDTPGVPSTLGAVFRILMGEEPLELFCRQQLRARKNLDRACVLSLGSYINKAEKERSGVRSTLAAALQLWANPMIDAATSASDFDLAELRRRPMTVYVAVSLDQLPSVARLLNLFFQQAISLLAERTPEKDERHQVLFLLDEFASLGRMDVVKDSLAFLAGFGVRASAGEPALAARAVKRQITVLRARVGECLLLSGSRGWENGPVRLAARFTRVHALPPGPFAVGFCVGLLADRARAYPISDTGAHASRPILFSIWYPAEPGGGATLRYGDYFRLPREPREGLPKELAHLAVPSDWEPERLREFIEELADSQLRVMFPASLRAAVVELPTAALRDAVPASGPFPLALYHPGLFGCHAESSILFEHLASCGHVVVSSAYPSATGAYLYNDGDRRTSLADQEVLLRAALELPYVDPERVAAFGHSDGAHASIRLRLYNERIRAVVSLDSTLDYDRWPQVEEKQECMREERALAAPLLVVADCSAEFSVWNQTVYPDLHLIRVPGFRHNDFISGHVLEESLEGCEPSTRAHRYLALCAVVRRFLDAAAAGTAGALDLSECGLEWKRRPGQAAPPSVAELAAWTDRLGGDAALARARSELGSALPRWSFDSVYGLACRLHETKRALDARAIFGALVELYPDRCLAWQSMSTAHRACGSTELALGCVRRWIAAIPHDTTLPPHQRDIGAVEARELEAELRGGAC